MDSVESKKNPFRGALEDIIVDAKSANAQAGTGLKTLLNEAREARKAYDAEWGVLVKTPRGRAYITARKKSITADTILESATVEYQRTIDRLARAEQLLKALSSYRFVPETKNTSDASSKKRTLEDDVSEPGSFGFGIIPGISSFGSGEPTPVFAFGEPTPVFDFGVGPLPSPWVLQRNHDRIPRVPGGFSFLNKKEQTTADASSKKRTLEDDVSESEAKRNKPA